MALGGGSLEHVFAQTTSAPAAPPRAGQGPAQPVPQGRRGGLDGPGPSDQDDGMAPPEGGAWLPLLLLEATTSAAS